MLLYFDGSYPAPESNLYPLHWDVESSLLLQQEVLLRKTTRPRRLLSTQAVVLSCKYFFRPLCPKLFQHNILDQTHILSVARGQFLEVPRWWTGIKSYCFLPVCHLSWWNFLAKKTHFTFYCVCFKIIVEMKRRKKPSPPGVPYSHDQSLATNDWGFCKQQQECS